MKKLTAEKCKSVIDGFKWMSENTGMSIRDEYDLQAYQIALQVLEQQGGWISCSERLPESGETVQFYISDTHSIKQGRYIEECWHQEQDWCHSVYGGMIESEVSGNITHWKHLPNPPADCMKCEGKREMDSGGTHPWGDAIMVTCDCQNTTDTYRQIENDGWIDWSGGKCPEPVDAQVEVKMRDGVKVIGNADVFRWNLAGKSEVSSCDIIAYRVIENDGGDS